MTGGALDAEKSILRGERGAKAHDSGSRQGPRRERGGALEHPPLIPRHGIKRVEEAVLASEIGDVALESRRGSNGVSGLKAPDRLSGARAERVEAMIGASAKDHAVSGDRLSDHGALRLEEPVNPAVADDASQNIAPMSRASRGLVAARSKVRQSGQERGERPRAGTRAYPAACRAPTSLPSAIYPSCAPAGAFCCFHVGKLLVRYRRLGRRAIRVTGTNMEGVVRVPPGTASRDDGADGPAPHKNR